VVHLNGAVGEHFIYAPMVSLAMSFNGALRSMSLDARTRLHHSIAVTGCTDMWPPWHTANDPEFEGKQGILA
jgi:hypothetical protein